jgi:hypothetical protein
MSSLVWLLLGIRRKTAHFDQSGSFRHLVATDICSFRIFKEKYIILENYENLTFKKVLVEKVFSGLLTRFVDLWTTDCSAKTKLFILYDMNCGMNCLLDKLGLRSSHNVNIYHSHSNLNTNIYTNDKCCIFYPYLFYKF